MKIPKYLLRAIRHYFESRNHTVTFPNQTCKHMFRDTRTKNKCIKLLDQACVRGKFNLVILPGCIWIYKGTKCRLYLRKNFWIGRPVEKAGSFT